MKVAAGTALRTHVIPWRVQPAKNRAGFYCLTDRVSEVRKLLRTDMSLEAIASHLDVHAHTLRHFIKRRNLCDLKARKEFNSLQKSLAKIKVEP